MRFQSLTLVLQTGEVWSLGCKLCGCEDGIITCYAPECQACEAGFTPYIAPEAPSNYSTSCCPPCVPASCSAHCLACEPPLSAVDSFPLAVLPASRLSSVSRHTSRGKGGRSPPCTACAEGYKLQNGSCVGECDALHFEREGRCFPCHGSCAACSEETQYHCTRWLSWYSL